mgnify:CR=1 FL=1
MPDALFEGGPLHAERWPGVPAIHYVLYGRGRYTFAGRTEAGLNLYRWNEDKNA